MSFQPLISPKNLPIKNRIEVILCRDFDKEISSITGIISKFLYVSKINQFTNEIEAPTIRIECGVECKTKCINLK